MCYSRELLTPFNPNSLQRAAAQWSGCSAAQQGRGGLHTPCNRVSPSFPLHARGGEVQLQEPLAGSPVLSGLPMGRAAALRDSGETLHGQMGPWATPPRMLSRATRAHAPSHVTGKGWWEHAQGLPDPTPPAQPWKNPLGWWLIHLGQLGFPFIGAGAARDAHGHGHHGILSPTRTYQAPSPSPVGGCF